MTEEEIKEYINRKDELLLKLSDKDKDTLEWILFGYNECARLLDEKEKENQQLKKQLQQKKDIINKARECIKENSLEVNTKEYGNIIVVNSDNLLEILNIDKGDE